MKKKSSSQYGTTFSVPRIFREKKPKKLISAKEITFCDDCSNVIWKSKFCTTPDCKNNRTKEE